MDITWHGNTCFELKGKKSKIIINPEKEKLSGEIVLSSMKDPKEVKDMKKIFDWPGEYEINGVPIVAMKAWQKSLSKEKEEGEGEETLIFYFEIDNVKCCHLGALGHVLTSDMVNRLGDVDILMVDIGTDSNLDEKKAIEVVEAIEPRVVIPMGKEPFSKALKELGAAFNGAEDKFSVKVNSDLPDDKRICVVLKKS